jgi:hypothetical protein
MCAPTGSGTEHANLRDDQTTCGMAQRLGRTRPRLTTQGRKNHPKVTGILFLSLVACGTPPEPPIEEAGDTASQPATGLDFPRTEPFGPPPEQIDACVLPGRSVCLDLWDLPLPWASCADFASTYLQSFQFYPDQVCQNLGYTMGKCEIPLGAPDLRAVGWILPRPEALRNATLDCYLVGGTWRGTDLANEFPLAVRPLE